MTRIDVEEDVAEHAYVHRARGQHVPAGREPREPAGSAGARLGAAAIQTLQRTAGNRAVVRLVAGDSDGQIVRRMPDRAAWEGESALYGAFGGEKKRSPALQLIDQAVGEYEQLRDDPDHDAREHALDAIGNAIQGWRNAKGDVAGVAQKPSAGKKRWSSIQHLQTYVADERQVLNQLRLQAQQERDRLAAEERDAEIARFVPDEVLTMPDKAARAQRIFELYMARFRGTASYTLKTVQGASMFNGAGTIACATISAGLRDTFRYAGLMSEVIQIPARYFITKPITNTFMDTAAVGNVFRPATGKNYGAERRFFFSGHWIVSVNDGNQHFDPTSGIPVSADGSEIIDPKYAGLTPDGVNYKKGAITLTTHLDDATSGSGYELKDL